MVTFMFCAAGHAQTIPIMQVFEITNTSYDLDIPPIQFADSTGRVVDTEMVALSLSRSPSAPAPPKITPLSGEDFRVESFFDIDYQLLDASGNTSTHHVPDSFFDIEYRRDPSQDPDPNTRHWQTEILYMSLSGSLPQTGPVVLDPSPVAPGHVTILKISGPPGGTDFQVDSFFDITPRVSFDGGNTFNSPTGPATLLKQASIMIPEPGSLVLTIVGAMGCTCVGHRRRRKMYSPAQL